jgi:hypothetical protein
LALPVEIGGRPRAMSRLRRDLVLRSRVVDHVVGLGEPRGARQLRGHDRPHLRLGEAAARAHARDLDVLGAVDDEHPVHDGPQSAGLEQQRHDQQSVGRGPSLDLRTGGRGDQRVQDRFEALPERRVAERLPAQPRPVEAAVGGHGRGTERGGDGALPGGAGGGQVVGDDVGVDDRRAEGLERS